MANKIVLKKSSVASKVPLSTDLEVGEIAVNLTDQKLYSKKSDGTVILVGSGVSGGGDVVGPASATDNAIARFDSTTGKLIQNSTVTIDDNGTLANVNAISLDTTPTTPPTTAGTIYWDEGNGTPSVVLNASTELQLGQENIAKVYNGSGATIPNGAVVAVNGAQGQRPRVTLADADSEALSAPTLGIATESIANGAEGFICTFGLVRGIDTSAFTAGLPIYLSQTAGQFTQTRPSAPAHTVALGWVIKVNASSGEVFVNINNGWELDELHNVLITSPTSGNTLIYDATAGVWENANITAGTGISVTNGAGSITVNNTGVTSVSGTGTVNGLTLSGTVTTTGNLTLGGTLSGIANSALTNSSVTVNGTSIALGASGTITANNPNALTINNGGAGAASGTTYNGSSAITISYNTVGAPSTTGTNASGTWGISISGNAATSTSLSGGSASATWVNTSQGLTDTSGTNSALRIANPGGASVTALGSSITGAIKITLPQSWTNTMLRMTIRVYTYDNGSFDIYCGGYNYGLGYWVNTFAYMGSQSRGALNVRFGHDGTNCCIYVGETGTVWSYPSVFVTDFQAGYSNYSASQWRSGWAVSVVTSLGTISETQSASKTITGQANSATITASTTAGAASTIVQRDGNGYIFNNYFNSTDNSQTGAVTAVMVKAGDNYLRSGTAAAVASFLSGQSMNIAGNASTATNVNSTQPNIGYSISGQNIEYGGQGGPQVQSQGGGAAMMSFHRPGAYAINFGLGTDNQLRTGGWSRGGNHLILDSGNYSSYAIPISGGINMGGSYGLNDQRLYLRTNGDTNHYLWNANDDWEELVAYFGTGFRVQSSNGQTLKTYATGGNVSFVQERFRFAASSGVWGLVIGESGAMPVDRGILIQASSGSSIPLYFTVNNGGTVSGSVVASGGSTTYNTSSDYRMKENVRDLSVDVAINKIMNIRPRIFDWKEEFGGKKNSVGYIAHELQEYAPECVTGEKDRVDSDGKIFPQGVDSSWLIPSISVMLQEHQKLIEDLKFEVSALKGN